MYDYSLPSGLPSGSRTLWSQLPLLPLATGPLTPFSYSVLAEVAGRAWYQYFDKLGFDPMPRARVLRQYQGRAYLNLTISAQRDAEGAGLEPLTLRLDGQAFPICKWEKPGLLAGLKFSLAANRVDNLLKQLMAEMPAITQQAQGWDDKTRELRWTQAEVLQIMEEIEQVGVRSFMAFFAARHHLALVYHRILRALDGRMKLADGLALIEAATSGADWVEEKIGQALAHLRSQASQEHGVVEWLRAGVYQDWEQRLPDPALNQAIQGFLATYGHRCVDEGEICHPRWQQEPTPILASLVTDGVTGVPAATPNSSAVTKLLEAVGGGQRKEVQALLQKMPALFTLQSQAQDAFAHILAGARRWSLAAARDALADQRLLATDDVFFYELEEVKQMMTGEWNISDRSEIQATARRRKAEYAAWQQAQPAELLIGEAEASPAGRELPTAYVGGLGRILLS